jgi:hypothetical protein
MRQDLKLAFDRWRETLYSRPYRSPLSHSDRTQTGVVSVLTMVTLVAAYLPARASRIGPLAALRSE